MIKRVLQLKKFQFNIGKELSPKIDLCLSKNSFGLVTGNNGEGKSLFFKSLVGDNDILFGDILHNDIKVKRVDQVPIAFCPVSSFDDYSLTLRELINLVFIQAPTNRKKKLNSLIELLELKALFDIKVKCLSAGEKKRLSILIVEAQEAEIYLYDEPEANLDQGFRAKVVSYLASKRLEKTIMAITHFPELYVSFCNQVMVINKNEISVKEIELEPNNETKSAFR